MKGIFEAEIFVETVFSIESYQNNGTWFYMSDYSTMSEFLTDCGSWFNSQSELTSIRASAEFEQGSSLRSACRKFSDEVSPEYIYKEWTGIPDALINRTWFCPNFFEIREALQMLDGDSIDGFTMWCRTSGHDIVTDDPLMLVTRYQDYIGPAYEPNPEIAESDEYTGFVTPYSLAELGLGAVEIFDDNYN